ncbi:hypothetical protein SERLA73DRAFT_162860 [Serpula lacrymans var. lacrymans S7.3]|uniref:DUF6535 domain-containing protein n=1 Tax=Serpula lacrymans var. lacrymans (strain S7.3) TaxID=936435 RepID=F8QAJ9_SERL3|nr:hypothetical protein SERLA73DRAFT_162860 [Serpula lacrymans var. lacrymans S7.3]
MPEPERESQSSSTSSSSHWILLEILETLQQSTIVNRGGKDVRSRFWTTYRTEAAEYDGEFLDKYKSDMDIVLIFVGAFSGWPVSF